MMQISQDETHEPVQNEKEKRQKARRDLLALLKRLRKLCDQFDSVQEWMDFVEKKVFPLLDEHQAALGPAATQRLRAAAQLGQSTRAGVQQACRVLRIEIGKVIPALPAPIPVPVQVAAGLLIFAAAVVGTTVIVVSLLAVQIDILNAGCDTIQIPAQYSQIPGFSFPAEIPPDGQPYLIRINPAIELDTRGPDMLVIRILGWNETVPLNNLTSMLLDDQVELLGERTPLRLDPGTRHTLTLRCE
jgi:hypothetical protein